MDTHRTGDRRRVAAILARVRRRWQLRIALRGVAIVLAAGAAAFLLSAFALDALRFGPLAVLLFRIVAWLVVAGLAFWYLVRPVLRRVDDEQVALYLEEHEPSLEATLLAAVEAERAGRQYSPDLVRGVVRAAVQRAAAVEDGRRIEQRALYRSGGALAGVVALALALLMLAPAGVRHGLSALLRPTTRAAEVNPYSITLSPGDVVIARGSDQLVTAALQGFSTVEATLYLRERQGEPFRELTMLPSTAEGSFEVLLLNLTDATDYFVEAEGTRSPVFRLDVADLPYVDRLQQLLRFPAYTALPERMIEDGGDVAAVEGTTVALTVHPTLPTRSGRLVLEGKAPIDLATQEDGSLTARFTVDGDGFYRIELAAPDGRLVEGSPRYTIDALEDQPPDVRVAEPGRDGNASPIEEVYFEVEAFDDYGVAELSLVYAVNGGEPRTVQLFRGSRPPLAEASAGHTVYLEELDLEPGDLVTYWAVGRDTNGARRGTEVSSDIYFLGIRALGNEYRQAEAPPGGGGGAGMSGAETSLSELQKQVIAATFNLDRDRDRYTNQEFAENVVSVRLSQERVREQVATLVERMNNRGLASAEEQFRKIAEMLPAAVVEMEAAERALAEQDVERALPHEQKALQQVQRAEETYERYVALQRQGGGGGGGGPNAEDLADLFELELDKLRNQYETVQRSARQQQSDEVDEVLERLQELAERQQQTAERRRLEAQGGSRGADQQRALAQQTEEVARQLETLARETRDQQLAQTARDLQDVAEQMRRSAAQGGSAGAAGASAAAERLVDTQQRLERERQERLGEDALDALERAQALVREQREVRREVRSMSDLRGAERADRVSRLHERKDRMLEEVEELREQLLRMSAEAQREGDRDAAQGFAGAADEIEERKIREKIAYSKGVVQQRLQEGFASAFEADIRMDLDELERRIADAREALDDAQPNPMEVALERARNLARGAETLDRRLQQGAQQEQEGGQQGPQGEGQQAGQGQQQGQQAQQGGRGLDPNAQGGAPGDPRDDPLGGAFGGPVGGYGQRPLTPEEIRSYRREFQERLGDARALRDYLEGAGVAPDELEPVVEALQALTAERLYGDLPELERLQNELREGLQRLEFRLRREVEGDGAERAVLQGSDEVPEGFRGLVEEYFRALSRAGGT